jgi:magnesium transporter
MRSKHKFKKIDVHKFVPRASEKNTPPGTVQYLGIPRREQPILKLIEFDEAEAVEYILDEPDQIKKFLQTDKIKWISVAGVHDIELISQIGEILQINQLELEDISNTTQRPRMEERENYIFLVFKALLVNPDDRDVVIEQVSLVLGSNYVISFQGCLRPFAPGYYQVKEG